MFHTMQLMTHSTDAASAQADAKKTHSYSGLRLAATSVMQCIAKIIAVNLNASRGTA
jgi:hypothetical protein